MNPEDVAANFASMVDELIGDDVEVSKQLSALEEELLGPSDEEAERFEVYVEELNVWLCSEEYEAYRRLLLRQADVERIIGAAFLKADWANTLEDFKKKARRRRSA